MKNPVRYKILTFLFAGLLAASIAMDSPWYLRVLYVVVAMYYAHLWGRESIKYDGG